MEPLTASTIASMHADGVSLTNRSEERPPKTNRDKLNIAVSLPRARHNRDSHKIDELDATFPEFKDFRRVLSPQAGGRLHEIINSFHDVALQDDMKKYEGSETPPAFWG